MIITLQRQCKRRSVALAERRSRACLIVLGRSHRHLLLFRVAAARFPWLGGGQFGTARRTCGLLKIGHARE
jgi:hypothetical protein